MPCGASALDGCSSVDWSFCWLPHMAGAAATEASCMCMMSAVAQADVEINGKADV